MKKLFFTAAILAASVVGANADTKMPIPTVEEAQQQGWEALWGDYQYGYVMPENYVLVDNEEVKVSLNKAANVATTCQVKDYDINLQMGSAWNRESNDAVWTLESVYAGMKQPYAVSFTYCRGKNSNTTMFVWDTMGNNDLGYFVTANSTFFDETADAGLDPLPHTVTVNVRMGHKYYIFGAETHRERRDRHHGQARRRQDIHYRRTLRRQGQERSRQGTLHHGRQEVRG